jgi:hypothetical protein
MARLHLHAGAVRKFALARMVGVAKTLALLNMHHAAAVFAQRVDDGARRLTHCGGLIGDGLGVRIIRQALASDLERIGEHGVPNRVHDYIYDITQRPAKHRNQDHRASILPRVTA